MGAGARAHEAEENAQIRAGQREYWFQYLVICAFQVVVANAAVGKEGTLLFAMASEFLGNAKLWREGNYSKIEVKIGNIKS